MPLFSTGNQECKKPLTKYSTSKTLTYNVSENEAVISFNDTFTKKP